MKGPKPKYEIQLLENEISELRQIVSARMAGCSTRASSV